MELELALATYADIVAELKKRPCQFVLFVAEETVDGDTELAWTGLPRDGVKWAKVAARLIRQVE